MAQLDDIVGSVMAWVKSQRPGQQHDHRIHDRQRHRELHLAGRWPDAFRRRQGDGARGWLPGADDRALAGQGPGRQGAERDHVGAGLVPDVRCGGRQPEHRRRNWWPGSSLATRPTRCISTGTTRRHSSPARAPSARQEIFYFTEGTLSAVRVNDYKYRFTDQPNGWLGATVKVDWPILTNLRLDPLERTGHVQRQGQRFDRLLQLVRLPVLAVRVRAAGCREARRSRPSSSRRCRRVPASTWKR